MITIQNISKQYGSKVLFDEASAFINADARVALIGPNGAGKSTLIKMILEQESPDSGTIGRAKNLTIGHLAQEVPKSSEFSVLEETMRLDGRREKLLETQRYYETLFETGEASDSDLLRYGRISEELEHLDEYRLESRAKEILSGMGFSEADFQRRLSEFSGGWLMRVALSRVLLSSPDLLLLDEPTNHLDLESLIWLEEFLTEFKGAILLVSHDTAFLNRIVREVLEIDQQQITRYAGNLNAYAAQKAERLTILKAQYEGQQAKIADIEAFVARFGAKATKARQAQSRLKQLEKMDLIELPEARSKVRFRFPEAPHSGKDIITMQNVDLKYSEKTIFKNMNWTIQKNSRVAIVGVNGAGKTSLLRVLAQELAPSNGNVKLGHQVKVGYYAQMQTESLQLHRTIFEELSEAAVQARGSANFSETEVRGIAGAFLFSGDAIQKKCSVLSGGEKARVALAKLLLTPSNFLILDEPTNHLDMDSRQVLLEALKTYTGTLCLVSHDREFMAPLVNAVLEIVPQPTGGEVHHLVCSYDDYVARTTKALKAAKQEKHTLRKSTTTVVAKPSATNAAAKPVTTGITSNQKRSWERERDKLEAQINTLESKQNTLAEQLSQESTYQDQTLWKRLTLEQQETARQLEDVMTKWEQVSAKLL